MIPLEMMREYLTGMLGGSEEQAAQARTVRLVIAGNSTAGGAKASSQSPFRARAEFRSGVS